MSIRTYVAFVLFCLCVGSNNLFSQIVLQGTVTDNGGEYLGSGAEPVVHALVTLTDQANPSRSFCTYTDEQGYYSIQIIESGIDDNIPANPVHFRLFQNYPNPFNPSTVICYELPQPADIKIEIYNILGHKIKTLLHGFQSKSGQIVWDATDHLGLGVPAGLYIYSLQSKDIRIYKKMLLIDGQKNSAPRINTEAVVAPFSNRNPSLRLAYCQS